MKLSQNRTYNFIHYSIILLLIHGLGYFIVKYFMKIDTEFGLRPSSWQGLWQGVHIVLSPLSIFALGLLWKNHIVKNFFHSKKRRVTGITLTCLFLVMVLSGYFIQVIYTADIKKIILATHLASSGLFSLIYTLHVLKKN